LASFHIITKDLPNWFWCTFHHIDNPAGARESPDTYGPPPQLKGTVWGNYVLGGTQIDFVTPQGKPVFLSDALIEHPPPSNFYDTSCMSCHALAAMSPDGPAGGAFFAGPPNPKIFFDQNGKPTELPTDFVFSIPSRAQ
jgi:hypothetical protein